MSVVPYFLGCPVWACPQWEGTLYTRAARRDQWLPQYSRVFNTVEGNSTFYAQPSRETVQRWIATSQPGFRFALKFPRTISHDKRLVGAEAETASWLEVLEQLHAGGRLGPTFLQLPGGFSGHHLDDLADYLARLPKCFQYAVELRHLDYFSGGPAEQRLNQLLTELHVDRVIFDSRALFSAPPEDATEQASQRRKPRLPVHATVTARHPLLRLVGRNDLRRVIPWLEHWAPIVAQWIDHGAQPLVFTHTPDERHAPALARMFHEELRRHCPHVGPLTDWPGELEPRSGRQLDLF